MKASASPPVSGGPEGARITGDKPKPQVKRIGVVGCGQEKEAFPCAAEDMYTSSYFRMKRRYAELDCDEWYILSARHHLLDRGIVIEPYNASMKDFDHEERKEWAHEVARQIIAKFPDPSGLIFSFHAGQIMSATLCPCSKD